MKKETRKDIKESITAVIGMFAVAALVPAFIFLCFSLKSNVKEKYTVFTDKRVAEMERQFGITVTDDIKLKKYIQENPDALSCNYTLYAENISDYHEFVDKNIDGDIVLMEEKGTRYNFEENTQEKCDTGGYAAYYKYFVSTELSKYVEVYFYNSDNGEYSAEFSYFL